MPRAAGFTHDGQPVYFPFQQLGVAVAPDSLAQRMAGEGGTLGMCHAIINRVPLGGITGAPAAVPWRERPSAACVIEDN